jgi:hypothetical protein
MSRDVRLIRSPVSVLGMVLTTISAVLFLVVFLADLFGLHANPYIGIVFFLLLPGVFLLGLALIPLGAWLERRRRLAGKPPSEVEWPRWDLNDPRQRRIAVTVFALTMANIVIVSLAAYRGVEYMDSAEFCGQACHVVMKPEFVAYQAGPHARVPCVSCHTGPGAGGFVEAKLAGSRRVFATLANSHPRPIPTPVETLRPARETCERCHWPEKVHGDVLERVYEYADDAENTETVTTLRIHVGGGSEAAGTVSGIHWHMNLANRVEYIATDERRQVIPWVRVTDASGNVREYVAEGVTPEALAAGERREMDCIDCHNRPAHTMAPSAERAVDAAIGRGAIPGTLPFVRREVVRVLKEPHPTEAAALDAIAAGLRDFYRTGYGEIFAAGRGEIERAVAAAQQIYRHNVFPEMNVGFGTYPNQIGHVDAPGCFRCHDDSHLAPDGRTISQDCGICHTFE